MKLWELNGLDGLGLFSPNIMICLIFPDECPNFFVSGCPLIDLERYCNVLKWMLTQHFSCVPAH